MNNNPLNDELIQICKEGDVNKFETLFSSFSVEQKNELIKFDNYACFHAAAVNGQSEIVKKILNYVKSVSDEIPVEEAVIPLFFSRNGEAFKVALANHHIETAKVILAEEFLFEECLNIISGNQEFMKIIFNSELKNCIFYIFSRSCGNNLTAVQSILETISPASRSSLIEYSDDEYDIGNIVLHSNSPFKNACYFNKLDILKFLWNSFSSQHRSRIIETQFPSLFIIAAKNGHLDIIKQLVLWAKKESKTALLSSIDFSAFIDAADKRYIEIVKFIWESLPTSMHNEALAASNFAAYRLATKNQHTSIIAFFEKNSSDETIRKMKIAVNQGVI